MTRDDLEDLEKVMMKEVVRRRALGGYDANAETVLLLSEVLLKLVMHLKEKEPKKKKQE